MREALALCRKSNDYGKFPWIVDESGGTIRITKDGTAALGDFTPLPTGKDLQQYWLGNLPTSSRRILQAIIFNHPVGLTKEGIEQSVGGDNEGPAYPAGGSSMREALAMLRGLEIVDDIGDRVVAADALF
jgi:hypothetical protein